jgi:hypothetical protein
MSEKNKMLDFYKYISKCSILLFSIYTIFPFFFKSIFLTFIGKNLLNYFF